MPTVVAHEHMRHENMDMDMDVRRATCDANVNRRESDEGATQLVSTGTSSERPDSREPRGPGVPLSL